MQEVEFLYRTSAAVESAIEDDIRLNLADSRIRVIGTGVSHDEWNTRTAVRDVITRKQIHMSTRVLHVSC
jgi:hypothetical protein